MVTTLIETLIVDGYNIIYAIPELERKLDENLKSARSALKEALSRYQATEKSIKRIYIIYDSRSGEGKHIEDLGLIKNIYTSSESNADREIVSLTQDIKKPGRVAVLSKDNFVVNHARANGVNVLAVDTFYKKINKDRKHVSKAGMSEEEKYRINRELRKVWGIE